MQATAYKTKKVLPNDDLFQILDESLPKEIPDNSVIAVTSKIIALCEGRVVAKDKTTKDELTHQEAELYLPRHMNRYDFSISIKHNTFTASAGVDESNANNMFVLWPKDPQTSANSIREHLAKSRGLRNVGVVVTDSKTSPLRWGVTGVGIAYSGFEPLKSYVGVEDLFGRPMKVEKTNIVDTLATIATGVMGEGAEQTPLCVISDIPWVSFTGRNPTKEELDSMHITIEDDLFAPLLTAVEWKKGKGGN